MRKSAILSSMILDYCWRTIHASDVCFFNGAAACKLFMQKAAPTLNGLAGKQLIRLPSSSPAHTLSFEKKLAAWQQIKDCL